MYLTRHKWNKQSSLCLRICFFFNFQSANVSIRWGQTGRDDVHIYWIQFWQFASMEIKFEVKSQTCHSDASFSKISSSFFFLGICFCFKYVWVSPVLELVFVECKVKPLRRSWCSWLRCRFRAWAGLKEVQGVELHPGHFKVTEGF